jgi:hypothetical protein
MKILIREWLREDIYRTPKDIERLIRNSIQSHQIVMPNNTAQPTLRQVQDIVKSIRAKEFGHLSTADAVEAELANWVQPLPGEIQDRDKPFAFGVNVVEELHVGDGGIEAMRCGKTDILLVTLNNISMS